MTQTATVTPTMRLTGASSARSANSATPVAPIATGTPTPSTVAWTACALLGGQQLVGGVDGRARQTVLQRDVDDARGRDEDEQGERAAAGDDRRDEHRHAEQSHERGVRGDSEAEAEAPQQHPREQHEEEDVDEVEERRVRREEAGQARGVVVARGARSKRMNSIR